MGTAILSPAQGWFAGLLVVMIVVTALFALILWIAIKPIKKDELDDSSSAKKALGRRETELTIELLNNQHDAKERAELENQLREVKAAERLVGELMPEEEPAQPAKKEKVAPKAGARHAQAANRAEQPKAGARPAQPAGNGGQPAAEAKPAKPAKKAETPAAAKQVKQAKPAQTEKDAKAGEPEQNK